MKQISEFLAPMVLLLFCHPALLMAEDINTGNTVKIEIHRFQEVLLHKEIPTLKDYYYWYGAGAEGERELALHECRKNGWRPSPEDEACRKHIIGRESTPSETRSLYFQWLRSYFPESRKNLTIKIRRIDRKREPGFISYDVIDATADGFSLQLIHFAVPEHSRETLGRLIIQRINGIDVNRLLTESLAPFLDK